MSRKSQMAKQVLSNTPSEVDVAREETRKVIETVVRADGHPFKRLSKLAKDTLDESVERSALSDLLTYVAPRMRALEGESTEKPVAVNINFDLSAAKDG